MRSRCHARKIHGLIAATQPQLHKKDECGKAGIFTQKYYIIFIIKIQYFFHFVQKFHEITIALIHSSEKNQACFVNQGRLVLFYLRTMSPFSTSTVIDVTGVSILSMIFSAILSSTLRRILFLRSLAPLVPPTDSFASSATASSV